MCPVHHQSTASGAATAARESTASLWGNAVTAQVPLPSGRRSLCSSMKHIRDGLQQSLPWPGDAGAPAAARRARLTRVAGHVPNGARAEAVPGRICHRGIFPVGLCWLPAASPHTSPCPCRWHHPGPRGGPGCWCWAVPSQHRDQEEPRHPGSSPSPALTLKMKVASIASCFTTHFSLKQTISSHKKTMNIFLLLIIEGQLINWA